MAYGTLVILKCEKWGVGLLIYSNEDLMDFVSNYQTLGPKSYIEMNEWNLLSLLPSKPGICSKVFQFLSPPRQVKKEEKSVPIKGAFSSD